MKALFNYCTILAFFFLGSIFPGQRCAGQAITPSGGNTVPLPAVGTTPDKPAAYAQGTLYNYLRTWKPKIPFTNVNDVTFSARTVSEVDISTEYSDGFGRPIQTVNWQASPLGMDIVSPRVYDSYGREQDKFLPYVSSSSNGAIKRDPFGEQSNFYTSTYPVEQPAFKNEKFFYSSTQFELSPQNRAIGGFDAGNSWIGSSKGGQVEYLVNTSSDAVQLWVIGMGLLSYVDNDINTNIPGTSGTYNAGQLAKKITIDVNGNQTVEFVDKEGLTVLKKTQIGTITAAQPYQNWLSTFYIYDDFDRLRFVISPKAVASMVAAGSWSLTPDMIDELCFRYEYDDRDRVIAKKVPGAGWEYIIYDQKSRPVFSQDANMRQKNQWLGNIYDDQDRIVQTGILTYSNGPVALQKYLNDNTGRNVLAGQAVTGNYMPGTFPVNYILTSRQAGVTQYFASGSITFNPGFTTEANANFTAEIIAGGNTSMATTFTQANDNPLPSGAGFIPLIYNYYNNYSATTRTYNTANNGLLNLDIADYADPLPSTASTLTTGLLTSKKVRVIEDANDLTLGNWLETANFYDDKGRIVQVQSDNYKGGLDYKTERYDFTGKVVCSYVLHNNPVAHISNLGIRTNTYYDAAGRVVMVRKIINETASLARITEYNQYDMLGKLKRKKLGQKCDAVTGAPVTISNPDGDNTNWLQINDYTYNIQGWLKGINWNYNSAPTYPDVDYQNNRWFALDLSYDWGFSSNQLNGALSGARWMSAGDGKERAYGYKYDATNRLLSADFRQNFGSGTSANWQVTEPGKSYNIDFSVKIGDGMSSGSAYDENGNILQMQQKGLVLNTSQLIDNLAYTYNKAGISNKLSAVTDNSGSTAVMGDFMDNNTTADDYGYDPNGNLITDMNKRLAGTTGTDLASGGAITYTYQGLPWLINVKKADQTSRGSIKFIYDATGKRLEKRVNEPGATIPNTNTTYLGAFVYVNDVLQYFNQENGKIRPTGNTQQPYAFDYFIKDQLHNTRVILTDEQQSVPFPAATVEQTPAASLTTEQSYYTVNTSNIVRMATIPLFQTATGTNYPNNNGNPPYNNNNNSNTSAQSEYMYRLNGQTGDKTGLGITIKVMTGDKVNLWVKSYYHVDRALDNSFSIANTALANFILAFAATPVIAAGAPHGATGASLQASPVTPPDVHDYLVNNRPTPSGAPKAFLNWILFDEQFRPVSTGTNSGFVAVATTADAVQSFSATATISTSGYLYVYCSNESNEDVYFDNLQAIQVKGPLLEETHYYPFGLTMEGISSRTIKANYTSNKIKLSGQIFDDELDLNTYQMQHRSMDPQIGRFQQIDPVSDKYCFNSTYAYAEDKVTLGTDLEGLELLPSNTGMFRMTAVSKPYYFGLTWEQSVQLVNRNVPSDFKGPDGTPLFSPSSVHIGTQGLMLEGVRGGAQFFFPSDQLPQNPSWPWDQSGADPDPSVSTSGRYLSPNIELSESWTAQAGAIASGRQELESWKNLIQSFPVWQARGDLYDNMYKFDAAIALEATFDKSIAKSYPFAYTPEVKDNLINFIADGTFPNSVDIMSSNFRQNLETNLMTGYFGLQVLQRADPSYIQQSTLDSYNWMVNFYNSLPGIKYNFIPTFLPNNGGFVSDTGSSSSSSMEGVDWEGDYGEFFDGGGYGGYGGGDGGD